MGVVMKNFLLIFCVWVLFTFGKELRYKNAYSYEWHDGFRYIFSNTPVPVHNEWLILLNKEGNQIKCIAGKNVADVGLTEELR
jgi:hypothetical protein